MMDQSTCDKGPRTNNTRSHQAVLRSLWPEVWATICQHIDGIAIGSTITALQQRGVLDFLGQNAALPVRRIIEQFPCNPGYLHAALRLLACQGWVRRIGEPGSDSLQISLTETGRTVFRSAGVYEQAVKFLTTARDIDRILFSDEESAPRSRLAWFHDRVRNKWGLAECDLPPSMQKQIQHQLDGHVITALMAAMSLRQILPTSTSDLIDLAGIGGNRESLKTAFEILACLGWAKVIEPRVEVTPRGRLAMACAKQYWYPMGYLETLINVPQLLFGDPSVNIAPTSSGEESHVDRRLDIQFSGSVFSKTCREPFLKIALPIFDQQPLETQPSSLVDTGCGDGTLLRVLFENIRDRTLRGRRLADYPLAVIGVEPNRVAREVAAENLTAAAIPHQMIDGDVAEPEKLAETLRSIGIDPLNALHVCKSVIHNRPYRAPGNLQEAMRPRARSTGAFTARDGSVIANALLEQNLVEHLRRWRRLGQRHGLLVIEAHTVDPDITSKLIGRTIATAVDATHAYSNQYLVEPDVFMAAAREAGFISSAHRELGRSSVGHTVLTIDHFVADEEPR